MMTLSVALSGTAFAGRAVVASRSPVAVSRSPSPRPSPVAANRRDPVNLPWDGLLDNTLPDGALTLLAEPPAPEVAGNSTTPAADYPTDDEGPTDDVTQDGTGAAADEVADAGEGPPEVGSSPEAAMPVAWGFGLRPAREELLAGRPAASAILATVTDEGQRTRYDLSELHDRIKASLLAEVRQLAGEHQLARDLLAGEIGQLQERSTTVLGEVRQLSGEYQQARTGLAGAVGQTARWLVQSRDELRAKLDGLSLLVGNVRSSGREDMRELRETVTQLLADQRLDYEDALADASAHDRAALEPLSQRIEAQTALVAEALEQQNHVQAELASLRREIARTRRAASNSPPVTADDHQIAMMAAAVSQEMRKLVVQSPVDAPVKAPAARARVKKATGDGSQTPSGRTTAAKAAVSKGVVVTAKVPAAKAAPSRAKQASDAPKPDETTPKRRRTSTSETTATRPAVKATRAVARRR